MASTKFSQGDTWISRNYRLIHNFHQGLFWIAAPLTNLLKKECKITWLFEHHVSFDHLKAIISYEPILKLLEFTKPFEVVTNASKLEFGGVLNQEERPVAYTSRKLHS